MVKFVTRSVFTVFHKLILFCFDLSLMVYIGIFQVQCVIAQQIDST